MSEDRFTRQINVGDLAIRCFGAEQARSLPQRGLRLLEESTEAYQTTGGTEEKAHLCVAHVFSKPKGELGQELGGVGVTTLALAEAAQLNADEEERKEVQRILSLPEEHFTKRNQAKNDAGLMAASQSSMGQVAAEAFLALHIIHQECVIEGLIENLPGLSLQFERLEKGLVNG